MRRSLALGVCALLTICTTGLPSEPETGQSESLPYYKLLVPEKLLDEKPRIANGFAPYPREEFWKLLEEAQRSRGNAAQAASPRINRATYRARWTREGGLKGDEARLEIAAGTESSGMLPLEPFGIAIGNAVWDEQPPRPALIGLSPQGHTAVKVDRSSVLTFPWSLRGKAGGAEQTYELALPAATVQKLTLELPSAWRPIVPGAIVTREETNSSATVVDWQIELGQQTPASITLVNPHDPASQPLVLVREASSVSLSAAGLDASTTFTLDIHHQPLTRLELTAPAALDIASVRVGDKSLPFKLSPDQSKRQRVAIELPEPLIGVLRVVTVQGIMPWHPGKPLALPQLTVEDAIWQEGAATLSLAPLLELSSLTVTGGRQTGVNAAAGNSGEIYQLQYFSPQAKAEFVAHPLAPAIQIESLGSLQLDPAQVSGVISSHIRAERGETFDLQLDISREWLVDSLDTTPPDVIEERTFLQAADGGQTLQLRLKQAIRKGQDLRLLVRARRRGAAVGEDLGPEQFRFLRFLGDAQERRTLAIGAADSAYLIQASGDADLRRIATAELPPSEASEASALTQSDEQLVFLDNESADSLRVKLQMEEPQFAAAMKVQATVDRDHVEEVYRVRLQPQGAALTELLVRFGAPPRDPVEWQFADSEEALSAHRVELPADAATDAGETWRLRWKRPRSESFELVCRMRQAFTEGYAVNWLSAPAAATQTGVIEIGAENGDLLTIEASDLDAVPPSAPAAGQAVTARAAFRYDPSRRVQVTLARHGPSPGQPTLLVRSLRVESRFQLDGKARHQAIAQLENLGVSEIRVRLPPTPNSVAWTVNGRQVAVAPDVDGSGTWRIPLPEDAARTTLEIVYASPSQPFGWGAWRSWEVQLPHFDAPLVASSWRVELPPGALPTSDRALPASLGEIGARLFGPLWRSSDYSFLGNKGSALVWTTLEEEAAEGTPSLAVCYAPACDAWGWASLISAAAVWLIVVRRTSAMMWLAACLLAVLSVTLPWPFVPCASGALLGTLAAWIVGGLLGPIGAGASSERRATAIPAGAVATAILLLVQFGDAPGLVTAQPPPPPVGDKPQVSPARRIIVPTDEDGAELPYAYVEPEFHEQLRRLAAAPLSGAANWLARVGDYRLDFQAEADGKRRLESVTAEFQLELLADEGTFRVPLARDQVHLLPDGVKVDRIPVSAEWTEKETEIRLSLQGAGPHTVEIKLRPVVQRDGDYERLDLAIPPIPTAQLVVAGAIPGDLELLRSAEHLPPATSGESLTARIGPTSHLRLRWSEASADSAATTTEGNQLVWWKIRPGGVTAEARFRVRPLSGKIRDLKFKLDPRMRVVAWDCDHEVASQRQIPDEEQWRLTLKRPTEKEVAVRAQFLLTGTTGIGNLVLPQTDLVADRISQAWIGFSTAAGLTLDLDAVSEQNRISPAEFLTGWGVADSAPQQVFRLALEAGSRSVVIRPEMGKTRYQSNYTGSLGRERMTLRWEAMILEAPSDLYDLPVRAPAKSRIAKVELVRAGTATPIRFNEQGPGKFIAHLTQRLEAGSILALELTTAWPGEESTALPELTLDSATEEASEWRLYRQSSVLTEVTAPKGWTTVEGQPLGGWNEAHGRLLGVWRRTAGAMPSALVCRVTPNSPQAVGRLVTSVQRTPSGWQAEIRGDLEITGGQLDQLRFDVPAEWSGPFEATPVQQIELRESSQIGRRIVSLKPPQPLSGEWKFALRGPLTASMGEGVRAPDAQLLDLGESERLLVLPTRLEQQRVEWQTSGLQATELPADWPGATGGNNDWEAFRAIASRFRATVKQVERFSGEAVVHLVDNRVIRTRSGRLSGESTFEIEPSGRGQVTLEVPSDLELVRVQIGPHPARLRSAGEGRWLVQLNSDQWPQSLKALYRQRSEAPAAATIDVPQLIGLRVENTLWSLHVSGDPGTTASRIVGNSSEAKQLLVRLESLMVIARVIVDIGLTGESPEGLVEGWVTWRRQWTQQRNQAELLPEAEKDAFFQAKLKSLEDEYQALLPRLPAGALAQEILPEPGDEAPEEVDRLAEGVARLAFTGTMSSIPAPAARAVPRIRREWLLVGIGVGLALALALAFSRSAANWFARWSYAAIGLMGALWLALLQPGWIGILILISAWGLAWKRWPGSQLLPYDAVRAAPSTTPSRTGA